MVPTSRHTSFPRARYVLTCAHSRLFCGNMDVSVFIRWVKGGSCCRPGVMYLTFIVNRLFCDVVIVAVEAKLALLVAVVALVGVHVRLFLFRWLLPWRCGGVVVQVLKIAPH